MTSDRAAISLVYAGSVPALDQAVLVLCTAPDEARARHLGHALVEEGLAACVNLGAPSLSIYQWQGALESTTEIALTIKTRGACVQALAHRLGQLHPYTVPELLVVDVAGGSAAYLDWLAQHTQGA